MNALVDNYVSKTPFISTRKCRRKEGYEKAQIWEKAREMASKDIKKLMEDEQNKHM